jgi:hypothetical protein
MDLRNRPQLEAQFARRLALASSKRRREFVSLLGTPPNAANIPDSFWDAVQQEAEENLMLAILLVLAASSEVHGLPGAADDAQFNTLAARRAREVAQAYAANSREAAARAFPAPRDGASPDGATAVGGDGAALITTGEIINRSTSIFGPDRDERIAVSETTWAITQGGELAKVRTVGLSPDDTWFTEQDRKVCRICSPLHGAKRAEWSRFFRSGPPAHPFCRCWIQYADEKVPAMVGAT